MVLRGLELVGHPAAKDSRLTPWQGAVVGASLALAVYAAATEVDVRVGVLTRVFQAVFEHSDRAWDVEAVAIGGLGGGLWILDLPILLALYSLLLGGLPLAIVGFVSERRRAHLKGERRPLRNVPYAALTFQIVSLTFTGFVLAAFIPELLQVSFSDLMRSGAWMFVAYFGVQFVAGMAAIPVWRRLLMNAPGIRTRWLFHDRA